VDRAGVIDYIGHPSSGNLDARITELIGQELAVPGAAPTETAEATIPTDVLG